MTAAEIVLNMNVSGAAFGAGAEVGVFVLSSPGFEEMAYVGYNGSEVSSHFIMTCFIVIVVTCGFGISDSFHLCPGLHGSYPYIAEHLSVSEFIPD